MRYTVAVSKTDEDAYRAKVIELPDCESYGKTVQDSVNSVRKQIKNYTDAIDDPGAVFRTDDFKSEAEVNGGGPSKDWWQGFVDRYIKGTTYYYTLDDERDSVSFRNKRLGSLLKYFLIICLLSSFFPGILWYQYGIGPQAELTIVIAIQIFAISFAAIVTVVAIFWATQSYWLLRYVDSQTEKWRPHGRIDEWTGPFTFHGLAESHKQWAELWFSWCVAIFAGGVTYAIYNLSVHSASASHPETWPDALYNLINSQAPSGFIYMLFGIAWYWASKHYRSHWHNFVVNAYRHRALYRFNKLRSEIIESKHWDSNEAKLKANETVLELYRLSGVLLLIPGESSYLDKVGSEEITKSLLQIHELVYGVPGPIAKKVEG
jgi:hypothetical protein